MDIELLKSGTKKWNLERSKSSRKFSIRNFDFHECHDDDSGDYGTAYLNEVDFSNVDMHQVIMRNGIYIDCDFSGASMQWSDLCFASFFNCNFNDAVLGVSRIGSAVFNNCTFINSELRYVTAEDTQFINCQLINTGFKNADFVGTDFSGSIIENCHIYGISSWDLKTDGVKSRNLVISKDEHEKISVDDMEVAQFIYLLLSNEKLRNVIDTFTTKVVLILGRFTDERKFILDQIKDLLRGKGYVPILFDFEGPTNRNISETVLTISSLSAFVIADITSPRSIPQELQIILPQLPSLLVQPIIEKNEEPYGMFYDHFQRPSLLELIRYENDKIKEVIDVIIARIPEQASSNKRFQTLDSLTESTPH